MQNNRSLPLRPIRAVINPSVHEILRFSARQMIKHAPYILRQNGFFGNNLLCSLYVSRAAMLFYRGDINLQSHDDQVLQSKVFDLCVDYKESFIDGLKTCADDNKNFLFKCKANPLIRNVLNEPRGWGARFWRFVKTWTGVSWLQQTLGFNHSVMANGQWNALTKIAKTPRKKFSTVSLTQLHKVSNASTTSISTIVSEILKNITTATDIEVLQLTEEPIKLKWLTTDHEPTNNAPPVFVKRFNLAKKRVGSELATLIELSYKQRSFIHNHRIHPIKSALNINHIAFDFGKSRGLIEREGNKIVWTMKANRQGFTNHPSRERNIHACYISNLHNALYVTAFPEKKSYEADVVLINATSTLPCLSIILDRNAMKGDTFSAGFFNAKGNMSDSKHRYQAFMLSSKLKAFYHAIKTNTVSIQKDGSMHFNPKAVVSAVFVNLCDHLYKTSQNASELKSGAQELLKESIKSTLTLLRIEKRDGQKLMKLCEVLSKAILVIIRNEHSNKTVKKQQIIDLLENKLYSYKNIFSRVAANQIANALSTLLRESESHLLLSAVPGIEQLPYHSSTGRLSTTLGIPNHSLNSIEGKSNQEQGKQFLTPLSLSDREWIRLNANTALSHYKEASSSNSMSDSETETITQSVKL